MSVKLRFLNLFGLLLMTGVLWAQTPEKPKRPAPELKGVIYNKEFSVGGGLHTHGFNISFSKGTLKKYYLTRFWYVDFAEIKHPREVRQSFDYAPSLASGSPRPFIYGKENSFFMIRAGFGAKHYFSEKAKKKGLAIGATYMAGATLGLLKPYYLDLIYPGGEIRSEKYSEENRSRFLNLSNTSIYGSSGVGLGWNEIKPIPGGFVKGGILFDIGAFDEMLKDIEVGAMIDVFPKKVPIMLTQENSPIFLNFYINVHFGKRW